ncbi:MAG: T9SS type A sorting domain-containing protein [Chitinophagales bacterium]
MKQFTYFFFLNCLMCYFSYAQITVGNFDFEDINRNYRVYLPTNYDDFAQLPLVINMHGLGSNALEQQLYSSFNNVADTSNFIVVYPNGIDNTWNVGFGDPNVVTNDVGFISALIDTLSANYKVDLNRVYSTGMSMGGYMTYHLACTLNDRIAAFASVTGMMAKPLLNNCTPDSTIPVLQIHGTEDPTVPYNGSVYATSVDEAMTFWANHNNCIGENIVTELPDTEDEGSTVTKIEYTVCDEDVEVTLYRINGGGHTWAGSLLNLGSTNLDIHASVEVWKFFEKYTLNGTNVGVENTVLEKEKMTVSPNPFSDFLEIKNIKTPIQNVRLYDMFGKLCFETKEINAANNRLNIDFLAEGMYLLQIETEKGQETMKVVK